VPHAKAVQLCRALDIGVVPCRALGPTYGSSVQIFEYLAAGACVVAPAVGQLEEVLRDGRGITYRHRSQAEMVAAVRKAVADPQLRRQVAARGREAVLSEYTWRENARRVVGFCEEICERVHRL